MQKKFQALSIIFLGLCIVLSSWLISQSLKTTKENEPKFIQQMQESNRYEYIQVTSNYIIIFDTQTGVGWARLNGEWDKIEPPISEQTK